MLTFQCPWCESELTTAPNDTYREWRSLETCPRCYVYFLKITTNKGVTIHEYQTDKRSVGDARGT